MADAKIAERDPIANLTSLLDLYSGKTTVTTDSPSTTTTSTRSNLTADQINAIIQNEMAPLAQASHGAGLSTYSDTNLALGRSEIAANVAAKYAGTTTTQTTSGSTRTTQTPGALSPSRAGDTLTALALNQIGAPIVKKLGDKMTSVVADPLAAAVDNFLSPSVATDNLPNMISHTAQMTSDLGEEALSPATSAVVSGAGEAISGAASGVGDILTSAANTISSGAGDVIDWLKNLFAEGGMVRAPGYADGGMVDPGDPGDGSDTGSADAEGYAKGGFVDRFQNKSILDEDPISATITAGGAIAPVAASTPTPTVGQTANTQVASIISGGSRGDGFNSNQNNQTDNVNAPDITEGVTAAGVVSSLLGFVNPALSIGFDALTGTESAGKVMMQNMIEALTNKSEPMTQEQVNQQALDALISNIQAQSVDNTGQETEGDLGPDDEGTAPVGNMSTVGDATVNSSVADANTGGDPGEATGGHITGPGTGTSDSIPAKLSNGEYVIDAKTVEALGPEFFQKIQAMFNPDAIRGQIAKGRI